MNYANVKFGNDCREKLIAGVNLCADAVETTYGPTGHNALIMIGESVKITKDGYHTAMAVNDSDPYITMGIKLMQDTCKKTAKDVGDGTSTSNVIARAIINEFKNESNSISVARHLKDYTEQIVNKLDTIKKKVETKEDLVKVASIAANNDANIGNLIADAFDKVGKDGIVTFEESEEVKDRIEYSEGFRIDRGFSSPYFINTPKGNCELEDVRVYISDTKMEEVKEVIDIANQAVKDKKSLLLIAPEFDSEILVFLSSNLELLKSCTVISPNNRNYRNIMLEDMRLLLGNTTECKKVVITKNNTTFLGCNSDQDKVSERVQSIREIINAGELNDFDLDFHKKRLANFTSGIATIYVGGYSKVEMQERYDRIEDAVCATQAALNGGILAGGGTTLATINIKTDDSLFNRFLEVLKLPSKILETTNNTTEEMYEKGVIEPFLVTKTVLENAVSTASLVLTANVAIVNNMLNF